MAGRTVAFKAVIWDMGGVILRTADRSGREAWEAELGLPPGELDRLVFESQISRRAAVGQASVDQIWAHVAQALGLAPDRAAALERDFWSGDQVDPRLVEYIRQLRPTYRTALLSNAWPTARQLIEDEWRFADIFDIVILSAEVGLVKPDPAIYQLALERLGVAPGAAVFIDDFVENVEGAGAVGLHAIHFQSTEQTIEALQALLGRVPS